MLWIDYINFSTFVVENKYILLLIVTTICGRYFLMAGLAFICFYKPGIKKLQKFKIQAAPPKQKQIRNEIKYSISTALIFSGIGIAAYILYSTGNTMIYLDVDLYGIPYLFLSLLAMLLIHDSYFYWTHRLLHMKWLFRKIHHVHHRSVNPTPLAAYSFHPLEALIEGLVLFPLITLFPVHAAVFAAFIFQVLLTNVLGHLGYELLPRNFRNGRLGKYLTSSTHHNLHHQKTKKNFGYYFTFWDRTMRTQED